VGPENTTKKTALVFIIFKIPAPAEFRQPTGKKYRLYAAFSNRNFFSVVIDVQQRTIFTNPSGPDAMTKSQDKIIIVLLLGVVILISSARLERGPFFAVSPRHNEVVVPRWNGTSIVMAEETGKRVKGEETLELPPHLNPLFFQPIPINASDYELLLTIPGVGPATATEILKTRRAKGNFDNADDLLEVRGIGAKKKEHLQHYVTF